MLYTLFVASFLSATILPFPSEAVFLYVLSAGANPMVCLFVAAAGNSLGGTTTFFLGRAGRIAMKNKSHAYSRFVVKYGPFVAFFSWVPIVGDILLVALGIFPVSVWKTLFWMIAGKFSRYAVIMLFYTHY